MMKRRLPAVALIILTVLCMTACDGTGARNDVSSALSESQSAAESTLQTESETEAQNGSSSFCGYYVSTGTSRLTAQDSEGNDLLTVTYPCVSLENADDHEALQQKLEELNQERKASAEQDYHDYKEQAEEQKSEDSAFSSYAISSEYYVRRADDSVLSLCSYYYDYTGGAHGYYAYSGVNLDASTGEELTLEDVIADQNVLADTLESLLPELYPDADFFDLQGTLSSYEQEDYSWCLDYNGITFFFNPYELASYAQGVQVVTLPFEDYPDLFNEAYTQTPVSYCVNLVSGQEFRYDLNGDDELESLICDTEVSEDDFDYYYPSVSLSGDGISKKITDDDACFSMKGVFFHLADGSNYIYLMEVTDNDYESTVVCKISNNGLKKVGTLNLGLKTDYEEDTLTAIQISCPDQFVGEIRSDALSTYGAYTTYHAGVDGLPVMDGGWYTAEDPYSLTLKQDMTFDQVSEDGIVESEVSLDKGTVMTILRTDNSGFVDFSLEDGSLVRAQVALDSDPVTVNGIDSEKVFDGMMYAG